MKKFLITTAVFLVAIIAIFTTLGCIKPAYGLDYGSPSKVYVYALSDVAVENGKGEREFTPASKTYREVLTLVDEMFEISMFSHAANGNEVTPAIGQDVQNTNGKYSSTKLKSSYAVALSFDEEQEQIVEYQGDTKKVLYYGIMMIINPDKNYQEITIYFKTSSTGSYQESPMLAYVEAEKLIDYIAEMV